MLSKAKEFLGVLVKDFRRYRHAIGSNAVAANGDSLWQHLCNRNETLEINPDGPGVICPWRWTSDLHACGVISSLGRDLASVAFQTWPIRFADSIDPTPSPDVSFIIAHSGDQRHHHVHWTVRSILAQVDVAIECIVVDQSETPTLKERLPADVKAIHRPLPEDLTGWRKSWAFNQGARKASGEVLVFHDGDILCPGSYAVSLLRQMKDHGAASIQRYLFNLDEATTASLFKTGALPNFFVPDRVRQNWEGGSIAVRRDAFFEMGGYDEAFVGWGGEDNEFFDRCSLVGHLRFGYVPFIHLWHPAQADKHAADNRNLTSALDQRLSMSAQDRARELRARSFGSPDRPDPPKGYRDG